MKTLTLKLPEILAARLNILARKKGVSKSEIVRRALMEYLANDDGHKPGSFLDLSKDLAGSIEGPSDLSTNQNYLEKYGK